ncbi:MAG: fimbrillin family protein [Candidatus Cryptobacteroides sp.]
MTRSYIYRFILIVCFATFASCTKIIRQEATECRVSYNVVSTKAASAFPVDQTFISAAYQLTSGKTWDNDKASSTLFINNEEVKYDSQYSFWTTDTEYHWPTDGSTLTFFSYAPASLKSLGIAISVEGVVVTDWDVTSEARKDIPIMVSDIAKEKVKNESNAGFTGVPTHFRHKLSKIKFNFRVSSFADEGTTAVVKKVYIQDIYTQGSYSKGGYTNDAWGSYASFKGEADPLMLFDGTSSTLTTDDDLTCLVDWTMMIPQSLVANASGHPQIIVEYEVSAAGGTPSSQKVGCYFDENLRQEAWEMGKQITYNIYLGVGKYPIEFDPSVSDWSTDDQGTVEIGD